jgi:hypothetical protein
MGHQNPKVELITHFSINLTLTSAVVAKQVQESLSMDILPDSWQNYEKFNSFINMVVDSHFVTDKPRFILESMKIEGWRFVETNEKGKKLTPIENEMTKLSCINNILTERTKQTNTLSINLHQGVKDTKVMRKSNSPSSLTILSPLSCAASKSANEPYCRGNPVASTANQISSRKKKRCKKDSETSIKFRPSTSQVSPRITATHSTSHFPLKDFCPKHESPSIISSPFGSNNPKDTPTFEQVKEIVLQNAKEFRQREMVKSIQNSPAIQSKPKVLKAKRSSTKATKEKKLLSPKIGSMLIRTTQRNDLVRVHIKQEIQHPDCVECIEELRLSSVETIVTRTQSNMKKSLSRDEKSDAVCKTFSEDVPSLESETPKEAHHNINICV